MIPLLNEEETIEELVQRVNQVIDNLSEINSEIIFVNNGSTDKTADLISASSKLDDRVTVVNFSRNFGHQNAVVAGLEKSSGDVVFVMDGDLQDLPEIISEMLLVWEQGADVDILVDTGDFRLMDRKVVDAFLQCKEKSPFIRGIVAWLGFTQKEFLYDRDIRFEGKIKYSFSKMLKFSMDGVFSMFFSAVQFFTLAIIGEYILITGGILKTFNYYKKNNEEYVN